MTTEQSSQLQRIFDSVKPRTLTGNLVWKGNVGNGWWGYSYFEIILNKGDKVSVSNINVSGNIVDGIVTENNSLIQLTVSGSTTTPITGTKIGTYVIEINS